MPWSLRAKQSKWFHISWCWVSLKGEKKKKGKLSKDCYYLGMNFMGSKTQAAGFGGCIHARLRRFNLKWKCWGDRGFSLWWSWERRARELDSGHVPCTISECHLFSIENVRSLKCWCEQTVKAFSVDLSLNWIDACLYKWVILVHSHTRLECVIS